MSNPSFTIESTSEVTTESLSSEWYAFAFVDSPLNVRCFTEGRWFDCAQQQQGWILGLNAGQAFRCDRKASVNGTIFCGRIDPTYWQSLAEEIFDGEVPAFTPRALAPSPHFGMDIRRFAQATSQDDSAGNIRSESLATLIAAELLQLAMGERRPPLLRFRHPGVTRVRDTLERDYGSSWTVEDMASLACLSRAQFMAAFKNAFGESPHDFLTKIRIREAQKRLARGEAVSVVGASVGFASRSGFWSSFRTATGRSPRSIRDNDSAQRSPDSFEP